MNLLFCFPFRQLLYTCVDDLYRRATTSRSGHSRELNSVKLYRFDDIKFFFFHQLVIIDFFHQYLFGWTVSSISFVFFRVFLFQMIGQVNNIYIFPFVYTIDKLGQFTRMNFNLIFWHFSHNNNNNSLQIRFFQIQIIRNGHHR